MTTTIASPQETIAALPETARRELAVWLLGHFDGNAILELFREVRPVNLPGYDYDREEAASLRLLVDSLESSFKHVQVQAQKLPPAEPTSEAELETLAL